MQHFINFMEKKPCKTALKVRKIITDFESRENINKMLMILTGNKLSLIYKILVTKALLKQWDIN